MAHDVFISYSSEDKAVADAVCATLEGRKIRCWIAPRDVRPGVVYGEALVDALNASRLFVLVLSSNSNNSPHVIREMEKVVSNGIPILPFRIENIAPSKAIDYFIGSTHWLDALTPPLKKHLDYLADNVELLLRERIAEDEVQPSSAFSSEIPRMQAPLQKTSRSQSIGEFITAKKQSLKIAGIIVAVLLVLAAGAYALNGRMTADQAGHQQNTTSSSGLPTAASDSETASVQNTTPAKTISPTVNKTSAPVSGSSQNVQTTAVKTAVSANSSTTPEPTPDFNVNVSESYKLAQQAMDLMNNKGDSQKVLTLCNQAIELNPNNSSVYDTRGLNYYYRLKQRSQGFTDLQKAIKMNPQYSYAYVHRGEMYQDMGENDLAINDFKKAIEIERASSESKQDCINEAVDHLKQLGVTGY